MIGDIIKGIIGLIFWFYILLWINSLFSDNPLNLVLIEVPTFAIMLLLFMWFSKLRKNHKAKYCKHGEIKVQCKTCELEQQRFQAEYEEEKRKNDIKIKAQSVRISEANKINNAKYNRSSMMLDLTPNEFEDAIAKLFIKLGYVVKQTPYVNDGGKDAIAYKDGNKYLIECKRYASDKSIGRPILQKFHAAMVEEKADKGYFVTTAKFTETAISYAEKYNIILIDAPKLAELFIKAFPESEDEISFKQICLSCGESVEFLLHDDLKEKQCINGHIVIKEVPYINSFPKQKKKRRHRRYYR